MRLQQRWPMRQSSAWDRTLTSNPGHYSHDHRHDDYDEFYHDEAHDAVSVMIRGLMLKYDHDPVADADGDQ